MMPPFVPLPIRHAVAPIDVIIGNREMGRRSRAPGKMDAGANEFSEAVCLHADLVISGQQKQK